MNKSHSHQNSHQISHQIDRGQNSRRINHSYKIPQLQKSMNESHSHQNSQQISHQKSQQNSQPKTHKWQREKFTRQDHNYGRRTSACPRPCTMCKKTRMRKSFFDKRIHDILVPQIVCELQTSRAARLRFKSDSKRWILFFCDSKRRGLYFIL